jgi:hypothetical protein
MNIKESQEKILKAVKEARKLIETSDSVSDIGVIGTGGVDATGDDSIGLNTATKETQANPDQLGLARGKLREKESPKSKLTKAVKVIPKSKKGDEPPEGYIDPKPGDPNWRVLVNKDAIQNPEKFVSDKHKEEQKPK